MFTLSLIAVIAVLVLPFVGSWLSARTLRARIEFILCVRHRDFLRSLKLGRVEPVVPDDADAPSDYLMIDGVVQPYAALFEHGELLRQLNDPELDLLVERLQRRGWIWPKS